MTRLRKNLDDVIADLLQQAGGDAEKACALALDRFDCGDALRGTLNRLIYITAFMNESKKSHE
jgi:hypothetical protein